MAALFDRWNAWMTCRGAESTTKLLKELNWEVVVVEGSSNIFYKNTDLGAYNIGGGKIFFTPVNRLSEEEIAYIMGHEGFEALFEVGALGSSLGRLPPRIEAEYIGMLLMASAGYDPHVAIRMNEQLWIHEGKPELEDPLSTHPSGKRMAQILSQDHVMEEALSMYREALLSQKKERLLRKVNDGNVGILGLVQLFKPIFRGRT
ncbi:hypothetical protein QJS04_geneDACA024885 [Acorus gramineus]|uniref:Peptidase M48 domain-containing protein n=1 Tax=Acorus gramineus TaxID=55184 RepID=A0AAV8ZYM3_ACOGR|nr:hypothetical protein QJS04_geneDACA024885 [Acorus gramineus]